MFCAASGHGENGIGVRFHPRIIVRFRVKIPNYIILGGVKTPGKADLWASSCRDFHTKGLSTPRVVYLRICNGKKSMGSRGSLEAPCSQEVIKEKKRVRHEIPVTDELDFY